jgi:hypothetical protein
MTLNTKEPINVLGIDIGNGKSSLYPHKAFPQSNVWRIDISRTTITEACKLNSPAISFEVKSVESAGFTPTIQPPNAIFHTSSDKAL